MTQEAELQKLREELKRIQDDTRRSRRRAAVGFVVMVVVIILSLTYAFVQQTEAVRQREEAYRAILRAKQAEEQGSSAHAEALRQRGIAEEVSKKAEARIQGLEKCCKKR